MSQPLFDISGKVEIPLDMLLRWITTLSVLGLSSWKCATDTILCDTTEDCPESTKNCILQRNLFTYDFGKFLPFPNVVSEAAKEKTGCLMILQADPNVVAVSAVIKRGESSDCINPTAEWDSLWWPFAMVMDLLRYVLLSVLRTRQPTTGGRPSKHNLGIETQR
jgi:hypothetical protein